MIVLGSTGSIGTQALEIARKYALKIDTFVAGFNSELLQKQIDEFKPKTVVVATENVRAKINHSKVLVGESGILRAIENSNADLVINALVGSLGLKPSLKTISLNKKLALANKESLVMGGKFLNTKNIVPIDSEHFGLWYLMQNRPIEKLTITASGGAFRSWDLKKINFATFKESQNHPNWKMGKKITVDSASIVNKLFEILECYWLFKSKMRDSKNIDAVIEKKSLVHAMIAFRDGSLTMHIAKPDMKLSIAYAIFGKIQDKIVDCVSLDELNSVEFLEIDTKRYPLWQLRSSLLQNPDLGAALNIANDILVKQFMQGKILFGEIQRQILRLFQDLGSVILRDLQDLNELEKEIKTKLLTRQILP